MCDCSIQHSTEPAEPQHLPGHLKGAPKVFMGDLCDVQPDLRATSISTGPAGHCPGPCHPNYRKRRRLREPRRVTRLRDEPMTAQGLPRGPTGQSPPSPPGLGKAAALRRQQENGTHAEWPLSHHLCSCSPPPTLSCTGRRTCMQIPPRAQRRAGPAGQGAGGGRGHRPHPERISRIMGGGASRRGSPSELGSPVAEGQDIWAMGLHGPGHSSHCLNWKLLALQSLSCSFLGNITRA